MTISRRISDVEDSGWNVREMKSSFSMSIDPCSISAGIEGNSFISALSEDQRDN